MTAIDNTRVELLREFGSPVTLVGATMEEMLSALSRGLQDPEEALEKPYSPIPHEQPPSRKAQNRAYSAG